MIQVRKVTRSDLGTVHMMEVKTQEFPDDIVALEAVFALPTDSAFLAFVGKRAIGYAITTHDAPHKAILIDAIGVLPAFRRNGVSRKIVDRLCIEAHTAAANKLVLSVPSYVIEDKDDPWNLEHWLWRMQFVAVKTEPGGTYYGREYEHYIFERAVK
ncbi:MAG: GNAT family N-acetyltransferase [Planctomycetota bacterium]|jgi:GNAT superfamily N-acetyltransferase